MNKRYFCIGHPIAHSWSTELHGILGNSDYALLDVQPENLESFILKKDYNGLNVTIPYKIAVIPYLDELDEYAERIGAVNTVVNQNGKLIGYNTDYFGFGQLLEHYGVPTKPPMMKHIAILGTGGVGWTSHAWLSNETFGSDLVFVSRKPNEHNTAHEDFVSYEELYERDDTEILINCTPVGMYREGKTCAESPVDLNRLHHLSHVIDLVYNPIRTELILQAEEKGIKAIGGLYMLVAQAHRSMELFGLRPTHSIEEAYRILKNKKQNLVLVGMPTCGKTELAKLLSQKTGHIRWDTDERLEQLFSISTCEMIQKYGIDAFRREEKKVIAECSSNPNGAIIATGGGAVLDSENVKNLKRNGRIVFVNRSFSNLTPTADRPMSDTREKLQTIYRNRLPIYFSVADCVVNGDGNLNDVLKRIQTEQSTITIEKSVLAGNVTLPRSKSHSHRALFLASAKKSVSVIHHLSLCDDILYTVRALCTLGCKIDMDGDTAVVNGISYRDLTGEYHVECGQSASTLRFLIPFVMMSRAVVTFWCDPTLLSRPLDYYESLAKQYGILFQKSNRSLRVGGGLREGNYQVEGAKTSQYASGMLMALSALDAPSSLTIPKEMVSRPYFDMTVGMLLASGTIVRTDNATDDNTHGSVYTILPAKRENTKFEIGFDETAYVMWCVYREIFPGIVLPKISDTDFPEIVKFHTLLQLPDTQKTIPVLDLSDTPDLAPIFFAYSALKKSVTFTGVGRLREKESNRLDDFCRELKKFGVKCELQQDCVTVYHGKLSRPQEPLQAHRDHRIVMALTLLSAVYGGTIVGAECVSKSDPGFFEELKKINLTYRMDAEHEGL